MQLINKTILITGSTSGIGYALGIALLKKQNKVILLGRDAEKLSQAQEKGFHTIQCDLSNQQDIEKTSIKIQNEYPDLDVLFNNAGVQFNYSFTSNVIPLDKIHQEIEINLTGQITLTQLLIPTLINAEKALIVNTTSGLGAFPKSDGLVYSASKAAMRNFTIGLKYALRNSRISVVEFIPPVTATNMTKGRDEEKMSVDELISIILPQLEKGYSIITPAKMRLFLWIAFLFPQLANKILTKHKIK